MNGKVKSMDKNLKRLLAVLLCAVMLVTICACGNTEPPIDSSNETTSGESMTPGESTAPSDMTTPGVTSSEQIYLPLEEIKNAIKIEASPVSETREIPLLIILVNYDANGNGVNDYDENEPDKLYSDKSQPYYGEQWAGTSVTDHYNLYFGDGYSLTNYYNELSMGAFRFVPIEFDQMPEDSKVPNGVIEVTVNIPHPTASGNAQGTITKVFSACDPYIDFSKLDTNKNGKIDEMELGVVILNPGADASSSSGKTGVNANSSRFHFEVWGTSQGLSAYLDGMTFSKVSNVGEYKTVGTILPIGVPTHELAHNLGAEDLYDRNVNATGGTISGWPRAYYFSLQCNGNSCGYGSMPSYLDPYQRIYLGWAEERVVEDGVYTIYSTCTNKYTVLRVNTPDPDEYYLIEIRLKEGFEQSLTSGTSEGGIMVWHIDEGINRKYFESGMASSSYADASTGKRHDPGIVPLFRGAFDAAGQLMVSTNPSDPFYYLSDDVSTAIFNSGDFRSVTNGTQSLNSYPSSWEGKQNYNLKIEVLSEPGQEMTIKITSGTKDYAPVLSASYSAKTYDSITVQGKIEALNQAVISEYGVILSTSKDFSENVITKTATVAGDGTFTALFDGLTADTRYYYKVYVNSDSGYAEATGDTPTSSAPQEKTYVTISLYSDADAKKYDFKVNYGNKLVISTGWLNSIANKKPGYKLEGWYYDAAFTKPYDMNTVLEKGTADFSLYAKWVEN